MPNLATSSALVETATKCLAMAASVAPDLARDQSRAECGVGHGFERGEGLGGDEEEGFFGVEVAGGFGEVGAVDVGDEAEGEVALASSA